MVPPPGGMGHGISGSFPNGLPQDGPRAGLPPMGLPDGRKHPSMPRVRPRYTPGGPADKGAPAAPQGPAGGQ
jgi:hypothetical protein